MSVTVGPCVGFQVGRKSHREASEWRMSQRKQINIMSRPQPCLTNEHDLYPQRLPFQPKTKHGTARNCRQPRLRAKFVHPTDSCSTPLARTSMQTALAPLQPCAASKWPKYSAKVCLRADGRWNIYMLRHFNLPSASGLGRNRNQQDDAQQLS